MEDLDLRRVRQFLTDRFGADSASVTALDSGGWSAPYSCRAGSRDLVVRFSPIDEDFRKDERAARFSSRALPLPEIVEIGRAFGGFYAVTQRHFGTYLEHVTAQQMRALLPAGLAMLDAIRQADVSDTSGYGNWGADGEAYYRTWEDALVTVGVDRPTLRIHGWSEAIKGSAGGSAAFREAYRALKGLAGRQPPSRHLIHSDLLHRNVLVAGTEITAVLDWGSALYGDFLFDLAWLWFWAPWSPGWEEIDFREEALRHYQKTGIEVPAFDLRVRTCALYIGLDGMTYQAWKGLWNDLEATAERTMVVLRA